LQRAHAGRTPSAGGNAATPRASAYLVGGVTIFTANYQRKTKHMKRYKRIRIIGVVLLVLGAAMIILALVEGKKSVIQSIGAGGGLIGVGGALFGMSLRLENKEKASGDPSDKPKS
jgi:hypothetical protein